MKIKRSSKDTDRSRREHSGTADLWKRLRIFLLSPRERRGANHSVFRESGACRLKIHCPDPRDDSSNAAQRSECVRQFLRTASAIGDRALLSAKVKFFGELVR